MTLTAYQRSAGVLAAVIFVLGFSLLAGGTGVLGQVAASSRSMDDVPRIGQSGPELTPNGSAGADDPTTNESGLQRAPTRVIVRFAEGTTQAERNAYLAGIGGVVSGRIDALDADIVTLTNEASMEIVTESPLVALAEPDYYVEALDGPATAPNDPLLAQQWGLDVVGAVEGWSALPSDAPTVTVAVIDSGVCATHPDLQGRLLGGWDFLENDNIPQDALGHGCAVSGVIAANQDNGIGMAGVAVNVEVLPLRVLDAFGVGNYSDVAAALIFAADHGAHIVNLSLGGAYPSDLLAEAVDYAVSRGALVVAAAGNTGSSEVLYPAAYPRVVAVGSVDENLIQSSFSSFGVAVDLWAPGRDILATQPDGTYARVSGTSFAAPHVAGIAALELGRGTTLFVDGGIVAMREGTADPVPTMTPSPAEIPSATPPAVIDPVLPPGESYDLLSDGQFVLGPNVAGFSLLEYIESRPSALGPVADALYGRSEYFSINPRVTLSLIEMASGLVTAPHASLAEIDDPLGVEGDDFIAQVDTLLEIMFDRYYQHLYEYSPQQVAARSLQPLERFDGSEIVLAAATNAGTYGLIAGLAAIPTIDLAVALDAQSPDSFVQTYARLFPSDDPRSTANHIYIPGELGYQAVPTGMLQLPYLRGETWSFNGVHNWSGDAGTDMSSIDFSRGWPDWGEDTSTMWVVAAAAGTPTRISDCYFKITHTSGWETQYYHLEQAQNLTGYVQQNQKIGLVANTLDEALCNGGWSTGPHVHFGLKHNGAYVTLDGEELSGWMIHAGRYAYDYNPDYMWFERDGVRKFWYTPVLNDANMPTTPVDVNLLTNGDFSLGETKWGFAGSIAHQVVGGVLSVYHQAVTGSSAVMFQTASYALPSGAPLELTLKLGNSGSTTKTARVILHDSQWGNAQSCMFTIPAGAPVKEYALRAKTSQAWPAAVVAMYIDPADGIPALWVDDISLEYRPSLSVSAIECESPPLELDMNLITNGDFSAGTSSWAFSSTIVKTVTDNVLHQYRQANSGTSVMYQVFSNPVSSGTPLELSVEVGNTSSYHKMVMVVLRDITWTNTVICKFAVPAGAALQTYKLSTETAMNWTSGVAAFYLDPADGTAWMTMDNVSLHAVPDLSAPVGSALCTSPTGTDNLGLLTNGTFAAGEANWYFSTGIVHQVVGGVLNAYRSLNSGSAILYQPSGQKLPVSAPLEVSIDLGNPSTSRKVATVLIHNGTWSENYRCIFVVPPGSPLRTFTLQAKTRTAWDRVVFATYVDPADGNPSMAIDNIELDYVPDLNISTGVTNCIVPDAPANINLLQNGTFAQGTAHWSFAGGIAREVSNGIMNIYRKVNDSTALMYQVGEYELPTGAPIELTGRIGNSSSTQKTVNVVVYDSTFADVQSCVYVIPAGTPLTAFTLRTKTIADWTGLRVAFYVNPADGDPALQLDDIALQYKPALSVSSKTCNLALATSLSASTPTQSDEVGSATPMASLAETQAGQESIFSPDMTFEIVEAEAGILAQQGEWTFYPTDASSGTGYVYSSGAADEDLSLAFYGTAVEVIYVAHPALGSFEIEIDGQVVETINTTTLESGFGLRASITGLGEREHLLRLIPVSGAVAIDAVIVEGYFETTSSLN